MKVKQLIKILSEFDQNADVILQKDPEGNGFSHLEGADHRADGRGREAAGATPLRWPAHPRGVHRPASLSRTHPSEPGAQRRADRAHRPAKPDNHALWA